MQRQKGRIDFERLRRTVPISAALGELGGDDSHPQCNVDFLKLGLSGWRGRSAWIQQWRKARKGWPAQCRAVVVAYADEVTSLTPDIDEIVASIRAIDANVLLIDTCHKNGQTLSDLVTPLRLQRIIADCHGMGIPVALAGSLTLPQISALTPLEPDWIAVRTAACEGGRLGRVTQAKVRQIADILHPSASRLVGNEKAR